MRSQRTRPTPGKAVSHSLYLFRTILTRISTYPILLLTALTRWAAQPGMASVRIEQRRRIGNHYRHPNRIEWQGFHDRARQPGSYSEHWLVTRFECSANTELDFNKSRRRTVGNEEVERGNKHRQREHCAFKLGGYHDSRVDELRLLRNCRCYSYVKTYRHGEENLGAGKVDLDCCWNWCGCCRVRMRCVTIDMIESHINDRLL